MSGENDEAELARLTAELEALDEEYFGHRSAYIEKRRPLEQELRRVETRKFIRGVPWERHTKETLSRFPFGPAFRDLIRELVPEPQRTWALEVSVENYGADE